MDGWVKLHRKTLNNPIFMRDHTAWIIFTFLLLKVDYVTGKWSGGRFQISEQTGVNSNTVYAALKRLEKAKMITLDSNNKYTDIYICKWSEYQDGDNTSEQQQDNNKITTNQQQDNTIKRNKEVKKSKSNKYSDPEWLKNASKEDVQSVADVKKVDIRDVQSYMEKAWNWYEIKPNDKTRKGRNWRATVMGWIQRDLDSGKIQRKIAYVEQEVEQISDEERAKNLEKIAEAKKRLFKSG